MAISRIDQAGPAPDNPIPKEWRDQGFSGAFTVMMNLVDNDTGGRPSPEQLDTLRAAVPYSPVDGWLALAVEQVGPDAHVIMVRRDAGAVVDVVAGQKARL